MEKLKLSNRGWFYAKDVDEANAAFGAMLGEFKGATLKGVWSLWDDLGQSWYLDWSVVLVTDRGLLSVAELSGVKLHLGNYSVDLAAHVVFFEEGCELNDLFDLSWRPHVELAFLEGKPIDSFFWRCDGEGHPYALDVVLDGKTLSVGGPWDECEPKVMEPGEAWWDLFDEIIVPVAH